MYGNDPSFVIIFVSAGKSYLRLFRVVYTLFLFVEHPLGSSVSQEYCLKAN